MTTNSQKPDGCAQVHKEESTKGLSTSRIPVYTPIKMKRSLEEGEHVLEKIYPIGERNNESGPKMSSHLPDHSSTNVLAHSSLLSCTPTAVSLPPISEVKVEKDNQPSSIFCGEAADRTDRKSVSSIRSIEEEERIPSFLVSNIPSAATSCSSAKTTSTCVERSRYRINAKPHQPIGHPKRSYVNYHRLKKLYNEKGPTSLRSNQSSYASICDNSFSLPGNQQPHIAKVITETISEFEEEEVSNVRKTGKNKETENPNDKVHQEPKTVDCVIEHSEPKKSQEPRAKVVSSNITASPTPAPKAPPTSPIRAKLVTKKRPKKLGYLPKKVTIIAEVPEDDEQENNKQGIGEQHKGKSATKSETTKVPKYNYAYRYRHQNPKSVSAASSSTVTVTSRGAPISKIPRLIIPGHGNPKMERVPTKMSSLESFVELERELASSHNLVDKSRSPRSHTGPIVNSQVLKDACRHCMSQKKKLQQSEDTVRYLTELLELKEKELRHTRSNVSTNSTENKTIHHRHRSTNTSTAQSSSSVNPLLANAQIYKYMESISKKSTSSTSRTGSRGEIENTTAPCAPKFDLDEFIRKFLKQNILFREDYCKQNSIEPFEYIQLFRASVAARECITQVVKQKLKYGYHILKGRYENVMSLTAATQSVEDSDMSSEVVNLLESHRRFVRFIYYFLKQSMMDIETFEETYIPLQKLSLGDEHKRKMKYSHETTMIVDGVNFSGVFIPIEEIS